MMREYQMKLIDFIAHNIERELDGLRRQLQAYPNENRIWEILPGIKNSTGTLALHLCGNLRHYIGAIIGKSGYIRDREAEFSKRDVPRSELLDEIDKTVQDVNSALANLKEADLDNVYPIKISGLHVETGDWILHLVSHLAYHLGQIDYHRRIVTGDSNVVNMLAVKELKTAHSEFTKS